MRKANPIIIVSQIKGPRLGLLRRECFRYFLKSSKLVQPIFIISPR
jgi:hypothetical protein